MKLEKIIRDGNFIYPVRIIFFLVGTFLVIGSFKYFSDSGWSFLGVSIGLFIAAIGGYSSQAHMLHLKPFDNSYKKAKESYQAKIEEENLES